MLAWFLAVATTLWYVASARQLTSVKAHMFAADGLKLLALVTALGAAIVEEVIFRRLVMDVLQQQGFGGFIQVLAAGVSFGLAHLVWGFRSWRAGINAVASTTVVGCALGLVYLAGDRSLAPCVAAHFVMTALVEPGLIRAALEDRIGLWSTRTRDAGPAADVDSHNT